MIRIWVTTPNLPRVYDILLLPTGALTSSVLGLALGPRVIFSVACGMADVLR